MFMPKGWKAWAAYIAAGLVLFFGTATAFVYIFSKAETDKTADQPTYRTFTSQTTGTEIKHDAKLLPTKLSAQDKKDKIVLRLINSEELPELLVTMRTEDGLRLLSVYAKQDLRSVIMQNISKAYPLRFPEYTQLSTRNFEVNGKKAGEVIFTYKKGSELIKQRFVFIIKSDDEAIYLAAQSRNSDFDALNTTYFDKIFDSLTIK
jgi:hypothetical protein